MTRQKSALEKGYNRQWIWKENTYLALTRVTVKSVKALTP